jgi:metal-sulfur cluster biosynthetic enzyme
VGIVALSSLEEKAMIDKEQIIANLREVFDPEISINIYDLGLIYDIKINQEDFWVEITHTLTSAFCPFADQIVSDITGAGYAPEVLNVEVITTFDPPFTMDSVSEETKMIMGW